MTSPIVDLISIATPAELTAGTMKPPRVLLSASASLIDDNPPLITDIINVFESAHNSSASFPELGHISPRSNSIMNCRAALSGLYLINDAFWTSVLYRILDEAVDALLESVEEGEETLFAQYSRLLTCMSSAPFEVRNMPFVC